MKFEITVEEYDSVILEQGRITQLTINANSEDEARSHARRLAKENFTINTVKRVDPPEEDIESNHYGMLSDEGNRHVSHIVNDAHKLDLTDARYLVALGNLQILTKAYSEAIDSEVRERGSRRSGNESSERRDSARSSSTSFDRS